MEFDPAEVEKQMLERNNWINESELKASNRPLNSLLKADCDFQTNIINVPISKEENASIIKYVTQRFREKTFDNYEFKEKPIVVQEEVYDERLIETSNEIFEIYNKIEAEITKMMKF